MIPELLNRDAVDPGTLRLKQERRNTFVISGTFEAKRNFGSKDTVIEQTIIFMFYYFIAD